MSNLNGATELYFVCPCGLTEITINQATVSLADVQKNGAVADKKVPLFHTDGELSDCKNYLGYLSERAGEKIPDQHLLRKAIVQYMLKAKGRCRYFRRHTFPNKHSTTFLDFPPNM